jgi:hypothetical protein
MTHLDDVIHNACMHANLRTLLVLTKTTTKVTRNVAFIYMYTHHVDSQNILPWGGGYQLSTPNCLFIFFLLYFGAFFQVKDIFGYIPNRIRPKDKGKRIPNLFIRTTPLGLIFYTKDHCVRLS